MHYCQKEIKTVSFIVENCPSTNKSTCCGCQSLIQKREIRITIRRVWRSSLFYHLECFTPNQFILKNYIHKKLDENSIEIFSNWLNRWNSKFFPLDRSPIIPYKSCIKLPYLSVPNRRPLIEVFKFLNAIEIFKISAVSKSFYQIAQEEELWRFLISRDYRISQTDADAKQLYIKFYNENCCGCNRNQDKNFGRCPLLRRTLCKECLGENKYRLFCKSDIKDFFGIDPALLNLKYWQSDQKENLVVTYQFFVEQELRKFRFVQKNRVLQMVQGLGDSHPATGIIRSIDINDIDDIRGTNSSYSQANYKPKYDLSIGFGFYKIVVDFIRCGKPKLNKKKIVNLIRIEIAFD